MKKFMNVARITTLVITIVSLAVICIVLLSGCNQQIVDTTWSFDKAIIYRQDGTIIEGEVTSWKDFENSDMVQVKIGDTTYLTHSSNVILIHE